MWGLLITLLLAFGSTGSGTSGSPLVTIAEGGVVKGQIDIAVPQSVVRLLLADAVLSSTLSTDVFEASVKPDGACEIIRRTVRGVWSPITYQARRCPTRTGWVETLFQSDTVSTYHMEWRLQNIPSGTRVHYRIKTEFDLPVPVALVQFETKRSVVKMLRNLVSKLTFKKRK
jgi:hypothetical protein